MDRFVSKIAAGGLSAGIFLIWWPTQVHGDGLSALIVRGLLWTLTAELLLLAFGPLEKIAEDHIRRRTSGRQNPVRARLDVLPPPARAGGAVALACLGLAGPALLLAGAPHALHTDPPAKEKVVKQVIVKHPVVRREVVVRKVVAPAAADAQATRLQAAAGITAPSTTAAKPAAEKRSSTAREGSKPVTTRRAATATETATKQSADAPNQTSTTPQTTEQPATSTTPAPAPAGDPQAAAPTTTTQP